VMRFEAAGASPRPSAALGMSVGRVSKADVAKNLRRLIPVSLEDAFTGDGTGEGMVLFTA
jgi:hypothetical protein